MKIKDINEKELKSYCLDLLFKTTLELGQSKDEKWLSTMSNSLAYDLKEDFPNMTFEDIVQSFRQGVRTTDKFVINVQNYYTWIKTHRQLIWNNEGKEERVDKRLKYRSKKNTGMTRISNKINLLK